MNITIDRVEELRRWLRQEDFGDWVSRDLLAVVDERDALKRDLLDAYAAATEKNKELAALKAEVKRLKETISEWEAWAERAGKTIAEHGAELSSLRSELDAARPLLEAAVMDKAMAKDCTSPKHFTVIDAWASVVLDLAEDYREGKAK